MVLIERWTCCHQTLHGDDGASWATEPVVTKLCMVMMVLPEPLNLDSPNFAWWWWCSLSHWAWIHQTLHGDDGKLCMVMMVLPEPLNLDSPNFAWWWWCSLSHWTWIHQTLHGDTSPLIRSLMQSFFLLQGTWRCMQSKTECFYLDYLSWATEPDRVPRKTLSDRLALSHCDLKYHQAHSVGCEGAGGGWGWGWGGVLGVFCLARQPTLFWQGY